MTGHCNKCGREFVYVAALRGRGCAHCHVLVWPDSLTEYLESAKKANRA